jgi:hypothetical protein
MAAENPLTSPCHNSPCCCTLPGPLHRVIYPPRSDLEIGVSSFLPQTRATRRVLAWCTAAFAVILLAFSIWFWLDEDKGNNSNSDNKSFSFWLSLAQLTSWSLFLSIVFYILTAIIVLKEEYCMNNSCFCGSHFGYMNTSLRVSANVHMWPTVFCISALTLIFFWSGASAEDINDPGAIPAHILFVFLLMCVFVSIRTHAFASMPTLPLLTPSPSPHSHAFLYRIPVAALGFASTLVTLLLYALVTGIYTLANNGVGPYEPGSKVMNWQTGLTASAVFIGLAVVLVFHALLYFFSRWRDTVRVRLPAPAPTPAAAAPNAAAAPQDVHLH